MHTHPFPYVNLSTMSVEDGLLSPCPSFCGQKGHLRPRCKSYYERIKNQPGPHKCPYGFSSYVEAHGLEPLIYTAVRLYSYYDRKQTKHRSAADYIPLLTVENIQNTTRQHSGLMKKLNVLDAQSERDRRFINSTMHEIRALNSAIISQSTFLKYALDNNHDETEIMHLQKNISATSFLISVRLNAYDFHANPSLITGTDTKPISIHGKFLKIVHCLRTQSVGQHNPIHLTGECRVNIQGYDIFDILPFVLIDNALKFSPADKDIHVTFFTNHPFLRVTVASTGPPLMEGEEETVFEESYRGINVRESTSGSGLGLYVAKQICQLHMINIYVKSEKQSEGWFTVTLEFDPETLIW